MPTTASSPRKMIWATAKSTDVSSRQSACPSAGERVRADRSGRRPDRPRSSRSECSRRSTGAGVGPRAAAFERPSRSRPAGRRRPRARPSSAAGPADARRGELGIVQLAVRRRRRVDDHRVDAAERRRQRRHGEGVEERRAAGRPPSSSKANIPRPPMELAGGDVGCGMAREHRVTDLCARHPDVRASARVPSPLPRAGRARTPSVASPRSTRNAESGARVAPVSIWTLATAAMRSRTTRRRRRRGRRSGRRGTSSRIRRPGPPRARAAGRRTARRTCCRRRRPRRGDARGSASARGRRRRSSGSRWSRRRGRGSGAAASAAATASWSVASTKSTSDAERPEHVDEQRAGRAVDRVRRDDAVAGLREGQRARRGSPPSRAPGRSPPRPPPARRSPSARAAVVGLSTRL